jgi:ATP-dependent Lon protease
MPGKVIQSMRKAKSSNPLFLLDEIDKMGMDFRGDPSSALLEVLDPEQNASFNDHYLEVDYDLSSVMFVTTANTLNIPPALMDRMEIIRIAGYTEDEKIEIAKRHLLPHSMTKHGLDAKEFEVDDSALMELVRRYTREAGVRNLEREIATLVRKQARRIAEGKTEKFIVTPETVREILGVAKVHAEKEIEERVTQPGVSVGLVWTPSGGDVIFIEASRMRGGKQFMMTGHLGEVMQESMKAALTWVRAHGDRYGIDPDFFRKQDIHVHVPSGAIPKDGPSAGVAMVTALVSLLSDRPVRPRVAMTGEMSLSGVVLPVGGIKEKVLGAKRAGVREIILPAENEPNVKEDLQGNLLDGLQLHFVRTVDQALEIALGKKQTAQPGPSVFAGDERPAAGPVPVH